MHWKRDGLTNATNGGLRKDQFVRSPLLKNQRVHIDILTYTIDYDLTGISRSSIYIYNSFSSSQYFLPRHLTSWVFYQAQQSLPQPFAINLTMNPSAKTPNFLLGFLYYLPSSHSRVSGKSPKLITETSSGYWNLLYSFSNWTSIFGLSHCSNLSTNPKLVWNVGPFRAIPLRITKKMWIFLNTLTSQIHFPGIFKITSLGKLL